MPIAAFENRNEEPLILRVEPGGDRIEIPHLATAGVRYVLEDGAEDFSTCVVGPNEIEFYCASARYEVDLVPPSPFDRLLWDICVKSGFCGGIVNGEPTHVEDLLPKDGLISAETFARLAIRAEGDAPVDDERHSRWMRMLEAKFIQHFGPQPVPAERLRRNLDRPFEQGAGES
ncbi:MAG: hypothetical protein ACJ8ER_15165 [Allosphingosinicella sp.]